MVDYKTYTEFQLNEISRHGGILIDLVDQLKFPRETIKVGRPRASVRDIIICCAIKCYYRLPYRRLCSLMKIMGKHFKIEKVPQYNTMCKYLNTEEMTDYLRKLFLLSSLPIRDFEEDFGIDSTGITTSNPSQYYCSRTGKKTKISDYTKLSALTTRNYNVIVSMATSSGKVHDNKFFFSLVNEALESFRISTVSGDTAYASKANTAFLDHLGIKPFLKPIKTATTKRSRFSWKKMVIAHQEQTPEWQLYYGYRNNVESTFSSMKRVLGENLLSKTPLGQYNECLLKIVNHNIRQLVRASVEKNINTKNILGTNN